MVQNVSQGLVDAGRYLQIVKRINGIIKMFDELPSCKTWKTKDRRIISVKNIVNGAKDVLKAINGKGRINKHNVRMFFLYVKDARDIMLHNYSMDLAHGAYRLEIQISEIQEFCILSHLIHSILISIEENKEYNYEVPDEWVVR